MGKFLLLLMVFLPLAAALAVLALGSGRAALVRLVSLGATVAALACALLIVLMYEPRTGATPQDPFQPDPQFSINQPWLTFQPGGPSTTAVEIRFNFGIDGISLWLLALTALLMVSCVLVSWEAI